MTNVPGPRQALYLAGKRIRDFFFWVPQSGRVGMGISILSYNGTVRLGVGTDAGLVPDPRAIVEEFHAEFAELLRLARERAA
jgi:diacylglycerol O-acyltransferase